MGGFFDTNLVAEKGGSAMVLWREDGTGEKWAVVRLGGHVPEAVPPVSFWPRIGRNNDGELRLFVESGRVRIRGLGAQSLMGGSFVPHYDHVVSIVREYPTCGGGGAGGAEGSLGIYYGPEPDETLDRAVVVLCRVTGGTNNYGVHIHHVGDVELYDVVRRVPVDPFEEEVEEDTEPPVANAGADRTIVIGAWLFFNGTASTDNVGIAEYTWTIQGGPTLYGPLPRHRFLTAGEFVVTLEVKDAKGNSDTDTMTVTVVDPDAEEEE